MGCAQPFDELPHMQPHLPETTPLSLEALQEMTAKYRRVFIKPAQGSLGRNIYILTRSPTGRFEFRRAGQSVAADAE